MSFEKLSKRTVDLQTRFGLEAHLRATYAELDRRTDLLRECVEALGMIQDEFGYSFPMPEKDKAAAALTRARAFLEGK